MPNISAWAKQPLVAVYVFTSKSLAQQSRAACISRGMDSRIFERTVKGGRAQADVWMVVSREAASEE